MGGIRKRLWANTVSINLVLIPTCVSATNAYIIELGRLRGKRTATHFPFRFTIKINIIQWQPFKLEMFSPVRDFFSQFFSVACAAEDAVTLVATQKGNSHRALRKLKPKCIYDQQMKSNSVFKCPRLFALDFRLIFYLR